MKNHVTICFVLVGVIIILGLIYASNRAITFEKMVSDRVIESAVMDLAADFHQTKLFKHYGLAWSAGYSCRLVVYHKTMGPEFYKVLYASIQAAPDFKSDDYWVKNGGNKNTYGLYKKILATAREALKNPAFLKATYLLHKEKALEEVKKQDIKQELKEELMWTLPYFNGKSAPEVTWIVNDRNLAARNTYEWAERRRQEGGDELVEVWAWILNDFAQSL